MRNQKLGFYIDDDFDVSGNPVANYEMSRISGPGYHFVGLSGFFGLNFYTDRKERVKILRNGNVGIGTTNPDMKLTVNGNIHAKEIKIDLNIPAPDYVFKKDYKLKTIEKVEKFIKENHHLPEMPSAREFEENGIMQAEMDMNLLKKIEELTLYTIQQEKEIENLKKENEKMKSSDKELFELRLRLEKLESKK